MSTLNSSFWLLLYFLLLIILFYFIYKNRWYLLTHENLFKQKLFLLSILVPFSAFIYFGIFSWWGHRLQLDSNGYENFYNISKLPLLLLAMSVPMAAIVNNIHRTIQTEKQILETQKKNLADSYYAHLKSMTDFFKDLPEHNITIAYEGRKITKNLKITYPTQLYDSLFPESTPFSGASYGVNRRFTSKILDCHNKLIKYIESLNDLFDKESDKSDKEKKLIYYWNEIEKLTNTLCSCIAIPSNDFGITMLFQANESLTSTNILSLDDLYKTISAIHDINMSILDRVKEITFIEGMTLQKTPRSLNLLLSNKSLKHFIARETVAYPIDYRTDHFIELTKLSGDNLAAGMINRYEKALKRTNHVHDK